MKTKAIPLGYTICGSRIFWARSDPCTPKETLHSPCRYIPASMQFLHLLTFYYLDLHILLNTLSSPSLASTPVSWLPICLPKFNPNKFLHAYVSHLEEETSDSGGDNNPGSPVRLAVVLPDKDGFERVRQWTENIAEVCCSPLSS